MQGQNPRTTSLFILSRTPGSCARRRALSVRAYSSAWRKQRPILSLEEYTTLLGLRRLPWIIVRIHVCDFERTCPVKNHRRHAVCFHVVGHLWRHHPIAAWAERRHGRFIDRVACSDLEISTDNDDIFGGRMPVWWHHITIRHFDADCE